MEDVSLAVATIDRWTTLDGEMYMNAVLSTTNGGTYVYASIQHFLGELPSAGARKRMLEIMQERSLSTGAHSVLLTDSTIGRSIVTAWAWLTNAETRAFDPKERRQAILSLAERRPLNVDRIDRAMLECYRLVGVNPPESLRPLQR